MSIIYKEIALKRINNLDWNKIGKYGKEEDIELASEFIRRMAIFCYENNLKPTLPFMMNIAELLGDEKKDDSFFSRLELSDEAIHVLINPDFSIVVVRAYLQLSVMADKEEYAIKYLDVYDPLLRLLERGGNFVYRERGMSLMNSGLIPLLNWYEKFKDMPVKDISAL